MSVKNIDDDILQLDVSLEKKELNATRLGRISRLHDFARHFTEMNHYQNDDTDSDRRWVKLYYCREIDMIEKWISGRQYQY